MADTSRVTPTGWSQGSDTTTQSRVSPTGWEQQNQVGGGGGFKAQWARGSNVIIQTQTQRSSP